jgi:hypothetical protein
MRQMNVRRTPAANVLYINVSLYIKKASKVTVLVTFLLYLRIIKNNRFESNCEENFKGFLGKA